MLAMASHSSAPGKGAPVATNVDGRVRVSLPEPPHRRRHICRKGAAKRQDASKGSGLSQSCAPAATTGLVKLRSKLQQAARTSTLVDCDPHHSRQLLSHAASPVDRTTDANAAAMPT